MKNKRTTNFKYFSFLFVIIIFILMTSCHGTSPVGPIINSFLPNVNIINEGDTVILSWVVNDANSITINQGIGNVSLSGSASVSPNETTIYTLTATNDSATSTATVTITVSPAIVEQKISIQPGLEDGKDAYVSSKIPSDNTGNSHYLYIGKYTMHLSRSYLQFKTNVLPADAIIIDACLKLFHTNTADFNINLHRVTESWKESMVTWNNQPDFYAIPEDTIAVPDEMFNWIFWDITPLLQGWIDGSIKNNGVVFKKDIEVPVMDGLLECYSSDNSNDPSLRPKLEITYYLP